MSLVSPALEGGFFTTVTSGVITPLYFSVPTKVSVLLSFLLLVFLLITFMSLN